MNKTAAPLPRGTYIELIRSLFSTRFTTSIMGVSVVGTGWIVETQTHDGLLDVLISACALTAAWRLYVLIAYRKEAHDTALSFPRAKQLERIFAVPYLLFAVVFGAFSAKAFAVAMPDAHVLVVGLLFGYAAGVAAGISYRLWISVTAVLVAVIPTILSALMSNNPTYWAVAGLLGIFLAGGVHSMVSRYHYAAAGINMSQLFEKLARTDPLTGLANRLALSENFSGVASKGSLVAIHCLDLDKFKPVNDRLGHPAGDLLLQAVAKRITALLRAGDFAARTGGDEFVIVQSGLSHAGEAEMLAARLRRTLGEPFKLRDHTVQTGVSVGYVLVPEQGYDLDRSLACADAALLEAKASGGGIARYREFSEREYRLAG